MIRSYPAKLLRTRRTRLVAAASAGVIVWSLASAASALPTGGVVFDSTPGPITTITPGSGTLTVDQGGDRVVIDWSTFNIGSGETVTFNQPDSHAIAFNRVDPSAFTTIDGTLAANGGVWLFSPGGLLFGANAQVNVGSFVGSTARLQDADATAALTSNTITATDIGGPNSANLTVTNGATLTASDGFMVLLGETIVQNGQVVSNNDAVWYGVAEGGALTIGTAGTRQTLDDATVSNTTGSTPSFTQGSTGVTTAGTWVGVSTPSISGWTTVLNLGGTTSASGAKPGTQDGVVILTGADGVVDLTTGDTELNTSGVIDSDFGVNIDVNSATLNGDIGSSGAVAVYLTTSDDIVVNGDIYGTLINLTSTGGDLTIGATSDIEGGHFAAGPAVRLYAYGDLTITAGASVTSLSDMIIQVTDAGGTLSIGGSVYSFGTGSNATFASLIYSAGDMDIAAGAVVDGAESVFLGANGQTTISGSVNSTGGTNIVSSDLTITGTGVVDSDASTTLTSYGAGGTITIDGTVTSGNVTTVKSTDADLTIDGSGLLDSADNLYISAFDDLSVAVDVSGDFVGVYSGGDMTITSAAFFDVNQFHGEADGDIQVDGVIDAPTTLFITSNGGDIDIGATADLSSFSVGLTAADHLSTAAGSNIDGDGGVGTISLKAYGSDGVTDALDLSGDITGHNIQLVTTAGSITLAGGTLTAENQLNVYAQGGSFTTLATSQINTTPLTNHGDVYVNAAGDINLAGDIDSTDINLISNGSLVEISGSIVASDSIAIDNNSGDVDIASTGILQVNTPFAASQPTIDIEAQGYISTQSGSLIQTPLSYVNGSVRMVSYGANGISLAGDITSGQIIIGTEAGGNIRIHDGAIDASTLVDIYSTGDLVTYGGSTIDGPTVNLGSRRDMLLRGDISGNYIVAALYANNGEGAYDGVLLQVSGDISAVDTIRLYNEVGNVELTSSGTLHGNTDASADNGGPGGYQTNTIEITGEAIYLNDGSRITVGNGGDPYRGTLYIHSADPGYGDPHNVTLGGYIQAEAVDVVVDDGSLDLSGNLYTTGALAFDVSGAVTMDYTGYLGADGYLDITAGDGIDLNGVVRVDGDINLTTVNADADINIKGDIYANGAIQLDSSADINLYTGGALQSDANTNGGDGFIGLYAEGNVTTQTGSNLIVGNTGYRTGDVIISADGSGEPIDLSGNIYARGLGLIAAYGSIHLRDGDIYVDDSLAINAAYDFVMDGPASLHSGGDVDITAQYTLDAEGSIYADGDVSFYKYGANPGDLTVGGLVHADGGVSIVNAGDGDVIIDGDIIADANGDGGSSGIYISSQDQVIGLSGLLQVGSDVYNTTGYVTIAAAGGDTVDYSAIDLNLDIIADGVSINPVAGSLHFAGGDIHLDNMTIGSATADVVIDSGVTIDVTGDVTISAPGELILNGDITAGGGIYAVRLNSGDHDLYIGGDLTSDGGVRLVNAGDGDVIINGDVIADADGISSPGYIYVSSEGSVIGGDGGLLQVGSAPDSVTGDVTINAHGYDGAFDAIDLSLDINANALFLNTENGSIHLGDGDVYVVQSLYLDSNFDILIDGDAYIFSGGVIEATAAGDLTVGAGADIETSQSVILESTGGDITVDGYVHGGGVYVYGYGAVSVGDTGTLRSSLGLTIETDGDLGASIDIDGAVRSNGPLSVTNHGGGIDVGPTGYIRGGTSQSGVSVLLSAYGDLTLEDGSEVSGPNDVRLETTGADADLTIGGYVTGYNIHVAGSGDITLQDTGYLFTYGEVDITSDSATPTNADISIDGDIVAVGGIRIANRNNGDVTIGPNAYLSTYYYYAGEYYYCGPSCLSTGGNALQGNDGDIYIYSAGQVVTVAGSKINATGGSGADAGLLTIVANGGDNTTTSAVDLSGDIYAYTVDVTANNGSINLRDGQINVTDLFTAYAAENVYQGAGNDIDGLAYGQANINIYAGGDIRLGGSMEGYYVAIESYGTASPGNSSIIDLAGYIYATDAIDIYNDNGSINVAATGELYVGEPFEASNPTITLFATGAVSSVAGSYIHTDPNYVGGQVTITSGAQPGGNGIDLAGDIASGDVGLYTLNGADIQITDGAITALDDITIESTGGVNITGGVLDAADQAYIRSYGAMFLGGDIYARLVDAVVTGDGYTLKIDGAIHADDYVRAYDSSGDIVIGSNADISSNEDGTINQVAPAVRLRGLTVTSEAGSLIETDGGDNGQVDIDALTTTGVGIQLDGDMHIGLLTADTVGDADIVVGGSITASDDIQLHSAGALTTTADSYLYAADLVRLISDRDMLLSGDIYAGNYMVGSIYGGEGGSGVDGAYIRVEGDIRAGETIRIYNGVGDVQIAGNLYGNLSGDPYGGLGYGYQDYTIEITGENIITEAGSLITVGADGGPRVGSVYVHAYNYDGDPTRVDLSGDIDTQSLIFNIENGSFRQREGSAAAINPITIDVDGYFQTDDGAYIYTGGDFRATSQDGMTVNGDITADRIFLSDYSLNDLVVGGALSTSSDINIYSEVGNIHLTAGADLFADTDYYAPNSAYNHVYLEAGGQVRTDAGSSIQVGPPGGTHGTIEIIAHGTDGPDYSAVDLSGDLSSYYLTIEADGGSIRLRDGDIVASADVNLAAGGSFIMDAPATIYGRNDITLSGADGVSVAGTVTALGDIDVEKLGATAGGVTINGYLYAGEDIFIRNHGDGDIVLGGPTIVADFDGTGASANQVYIAAYGGAVVAPGGGSIQVGADGYEHGSITVYAGGADALTNSAIDLTGITLTADDVTLTTEVGSIHLGSSTVLDAGDDVTLDSGATIVTDSKAHIYAGDDVNFTADDGMAVGGELTAGGDISLTVPATGPGPGPGQYGFTAGPGDLVVSGVLTANGQVAVSNYSGGDVYLSGELHSDADGVDVYGGEGVRVNVYNGQFISGANSVMQAGPDGTPTSYVSVSAFGADSANYSSIDLSGDITAGGLFLIAGDSVHLRDGDINATGDIYIGAYGYFLMDARATLVGGGDVDIIAATGIQSYGDITAGGDVYFHLDPNAVFAGFVANAGDVVVGGNVTADGAITIVNEATGDIYIDGTAYLHADADSSNGVYEDITIDSNGQVISAAGSSMVVGDVGATTGGVYIFAGGADNASYSSVDLSGDIDADSLYVTTDGSIRLRDGDIVVSGDLFLGTYVDFLMDAPATIDAAGDVTIVAANSLRSYGDITSGGTIYLHLDPDAYFGSAFTAGAGDLVVGGNLTANGSIDITNDGSGDIYIDGTAAILADADSTGGPDHISVTSDGLIISAKGSSMVVGAAGATTGDVTLTAGGGDNANYSAIDLSGDIDADTLTLDADNGSIHLADGTITVAEDLDITNSFHIVMDAPASIDGAGDVSMTAGLSLQVNGTVYSGGDIDLLLTGANAMDLTIGGDLAADGSITAENAGNGLLTIFEDGSLDAGSFVNLTSNGDLTVDGTVLSAGNVLAYSGSDIDVGGSINAGSGVSLNADADINLSGDIDTTIGQLFADAGGDLTQVSGTLSTGQGNIYLHAAGDLTLDGFSYSGAAFDTRSGGDTGIGGVIDADDSVQMIAQGDLLLSGDVYASDYVYGRAFGVLYQTADSTLGGGGLVRLIATYGMTVDGVVNGNNVDLFVYGGEGVGYLDIDGQVTADYDITVRNDAPGDVHLGSDAVLIAGAGGSYSAITIESGGRVISDAGSIMHVGQTDDRNGFIGIYADGADGPTTSAIDLSGDIDASSVSLIAYDGSVQVREGSVRADESIDIYATEFFILGEDGIISGAEDRAVDMPKPTGVVVYAAYDLAPGVSIAASDVDIEGHIVSGDMIVIGAYNVSGGNVTVGGADPLNLGVGFTLSNAEFQNLSADSIVVLAGQGTGYASAGYDLHIADLTIDADNVDDVWFGSQEDIIVDGDVTPSGEGVDLHLGFALAFTQEDDFAANTFLVGFVPDNILISGSLGSADNPLGSVTLIAQGDILMGSSEFITAALGPDFDPTVEYPTPGDNHVFIAADALQMAAMGDILQQNTGVNGQFGGLIIGLPQPGQELIFIPDQIDGLQIGGPSGFTADFGAGPTSIDLFGQFVGPNGQTVGGFNAANVDNLLDPDLLVGDYFFNSCLFYGECGTDEDIPIFHDPAPPVQLDTEDLLSFFSGFPFAEPDDDDDDDDVEGEPVTGSGNEDLWTMKPTGVRP